MGDSFNRTYHCICGYQIQKLKAVKNEKVVKIKRKSFTYEDLPNVPKQEEEDVENIKKSLELI
jgi:hypothetical protein